MELEEISASLREKGAKYVDYNFLYQFAKENQGYINVSSETDKIGKLTKISEILTALKQLECDLYCLIKQEAISRDEEYVALQKAFFDKISPKLN